MQMRRIEIKVGGILQRIHVPLHLCNLYFKRGAFAVCACK